MFFVNAAELKTETIHVSVLGSGGVGKRYTQYNKSWWMHIY
jgi:hypothetical protein